MQTIRKIAAAVIKDNKYLMVRKVGSDIWTSLGGRPEAGESEEQTLLREIKEEMGCGANIIEKIGTFTAPAVHDPAMVELSVYLVGLQGEIKFADPELAEYKFLGSDWNKQGIKLPPSIQFQVLPYCIKTGLLKW